MHLDGERTLRFRVLALGSWDEEGLGRRDALRRWLAPPRRRCVSAVGIGWRSGLLWPLLFTSCRSFSHYAKRGVTIRPVTTRSPGFPVVASWSESESHELRPYLMQGPETSISLGRVPHHPAFRRPQTLTPEMLDGHGSPAACRQSHLPSRTTSHEPRTT